MFYEKKGAKFQRRPQNQASSQLKKEENEALFKLLGPDNYSLAAGAAELHEKRGEGLQKLHSGVVSFVKDYSSKCYSLRLFDLKAEALLWEETVICDGSFQIFPDEHSQPYMGFLSKNGGFALKISDSTDAARIRESLKKCLVIGKKKMAESLEDVEETKIEGKLEFQSSPAMETPPKGRKQSGQKLSPAMISKPTKFEHLVHVGWDTIKQEFVGKVREGAAVDPTVNELLKATGRKPVFYAALDEKTERVKKEPPPRRRRAPAAPPEEEKLKLQDVPKPEKPKSKPEEQETPDPDSAAATQMLQSSYLKLASQEEKPKPEETANEAEKSAVAEIAEAKPEIKMQYIPSPELESAMQAILEACGFHVEKLSATQLRTIDEVADKHGGFERIARLMQEEKHKVELNVPSASAEKPEPPLIEEKKPILPKEEPKPTIKIDEIPEQKPARPIPPPRKCPGCSKCSEH